MLNIVVCDLGTLENTGVMQCFIPLEIIDPVPMVIFGVRIGVLFMNYRGQNVGEKDRFIKNIIKSNCKQKSSIKVCLV